MARILVTEEIADGGLERLRQAPAKEIVGAEDGKGDEIGLPLQDLAGGSGGLDRALIKIRREVAQDLVGGVRHLPGEHDVHDEGDDEGDDGVDDDVSGIVYGEAVCAGRPAVGSCEDDNEGNDADDVVDPHDY